jgi:hypothetical protein
VKILAWIFTGSIAALAAAGYALFRGLDRQLRDARW